MVCSQRVQRDSADARVGEDLLRHGVVKGRVLADFPVDRRLREQQAGEYFRQRADLEARMDLRFGGFAEKPTRALVALDPADRELVVGARVDTRLQRLPVRRGIQRIGVRRSDAEQRKKYTKRFVEGKAGHGCGAYRNAVTESDTQFRYPSRPCALR